jgi:amylosucrase
MCAWDGIPLLYMGDEIGLRNDEGYVDRPDHAGDNRWLHRPTMDWAAAERRRTPGTAEARIFGDLARLSEARRAAPQLHAANPLEIVDLGDPALFAFVRTHPEGALVAIHNFADAPRSVDVGRLPGHASRAAADLLDDAWAPADDAVDIPARGVRWLVAGPLSR